MPSVKAGMYLNSAVAGTFPGGLLAWTKAGCEMLYVPVLLSNDMLYALLPEQAVSGMDLTLFKQRIAAFCRQQRVDLRWIAHGNFEGMDPLEVKQALEKRLAELPDDSRLAGVLNRPPVLLLTASPGCTQSEAERLPRHFEGIKGLRRIAVQWSGGIVEWESGGQTVEVNTPALRKQPAVAPCQRGPISADDVIRVHELLRTAANVDEFVRSISVPEPGAR